MPSHKKHVITIGTQIGMLENSKFAPADITRKSIRTKAIVKGISKSTSALDIIDLSNTISSALENKKPREEDIISMQTKTVPSQVEFEIMELLRSMNSSKDDSGLFDAVSKINHSGVTKKLFNKFKVFKSAKVNDKKKKKLEQVHSKRQKAVSKKVLKEMKLLQSQRNVGLYVMCDRCDKLRYLRNCVDPLDLPDKWYCENDNKTCSDPETEVAPEVEADLIDNLYNAGSIVWGKFTGWPWWPAMVDDDPDYLKYYWLEGKSNVPTWYNVTFFDSAKVTTAWLKPEAIVPFKINMNNPKFLLNKRNRNYRRVSVASKQANQAQELLLSQRLKKFSFMSRYIEKKGVKKSVAEGRNGDKKTMKKSAKKCNRDIIENDDFSSAVVEVMINSISPELFEYV